MENKNQSFQLKTNINCSGCVAAVKPHLDKIAGVDGWEVDTAGKNKILTVKAGGVTEEQVVEAVQKAGFKAEPAV